METEGETRRLIRISSQNGSPAEEEETRAFSLRISNPEGQQWDDDHVAEIYKDQDLYLAAKNGNLQEFTKLLDRVSATEHVNFHDILSRFSPVGNTFLHVAAKHGRENVVNFIAERDPYLVLSKNFDGETALHLAAKSGQALTVEALVKVHQILLRDGDKGDDNNLLRAKNKRGDTALHEALLNILESKRGKTDLQLEGWIRIAKYLIQNDSELSYYQNKDEEFALYLAAKAGLQDCVSLILQLSTDQERIHQLIEQKSPIEAAIQGKHKDVLEAMYNMNPSLFQLRDGESRNPLHYAAASGYLEGSILLRNQFPDPEEVLDREGRNILHLAATQGRSNVVSYVLKNPNLQELINMRDESGNTPLHLATRNWRPLVVRAE